MDSNWIGLFQMVNASKNVVLLLGLVREHFVRILVSIDDAKKRAGVLESYN